MRRLGMAMSGALLLAGTAGCLPAASHATPVRPARTRSLSRHARPLTLEVAPPRPTAPASAAPRPTPVRTGATATLTFDDGPYPRTTPAVLSLLKKYHVHAVFCEIGLRARQYPAVVREVVAAGDVLCDHTVHHYDDLDRVSARLVDEEVTGAYDDIIRASGGVHPRYFRAPQGRWTVAMWHDVTRLGMTNLYWTVDSMDWARLPARTVVARVVHGLRPGGIVLMHDRDINRRQTLTALSRLLTVLPRMGYRFVLPPPTYRFGIRAALAADRGTRAFTRRWQKSHPHWRALPPAGTPRHTGGSPPHRHVAQRATATEPAGPQLQ